MKRKWILMLLTSILASSTILSACSTSNETVATKKENKEEGPVDLGTPPGNPKEIPENLNIDWNYRYHFNELEDQLTAMADTYPDLTEKYSIGTSWRERDLWCLEITNEKSKNENKTGIGIFANIHGGERESASSAMYTAWWTLLNSKEDYVKKMLDNYILYVIPVINPDGYEESFVINTRENLRPRDKNGDDTYFSDPYTDIDGDGFIATLYRGTADMQPDPYGDLPEGMKRFGRESKDWDKNGILGDDPRNSGIDMNRTFDYQWNRFDIDTVGTTNIGGETWGGAGDGPATEPEVQAVQNFLKKTPMHALVSLHTYIQAVLYPWCYRDYDPENPIDKDLPFIKETSEKMAAKFSETTGRKYYSKDSHNDYPTSAELIDYAYGKFGIHAYTIEVYCASTSEQNEGSEYVWGNQLPDPKWVFYDQTQLKAMCEKEGIDFASLTDTKGEPLKENEGLWFCTSSDNQMVNRTPEDQDKVVEGAKDAILTMIESEPYGDGSKVPDYMK